MIACCLRAVTRTCTARPGEVRVFPNLGASRRRRRRHRGMGAGHHEAAEATTGRGPQGAPYSKYSTRSPRSRWLARLTGRRAQHRSLHGQQDLTHTHRDALGNGNPSFYIATSPPRPWRHWSITWAGPLDCVRPRSGAVYMPVTAHHHNTRVDSKTKKEGNPGTPGQLFWSTASMATPRGRAHEGRVAVARVRYSYGADTQTRRHGVGHRGWRRCPGLCSSPLRPQAACGKQFARWCTLQTLPRCPARV